MLLVALKHQEHRERRSRPLPVPDLPDPVRAMVLPRGHGALDHDARGVVELGVVRQCGGRFGLEPGEALEVLGGDCVHGGPGVKAAVLDAVDVFAVRVLLVPHVRADGVQKREVAPQRVVGVAGEALDELLPEVVEGLSARGMVQFPLAHLQRS